MEKKTKTMIAIAIVAIIIIAAAAVAITSLSKDNDDSGPITVVDGEGRTVTITTSDNIACTSATVTEIICGVGGFSKIAGVTNDDAYSVSDSILGIPNDGFPDAIVDGLEDGTLIDMGGMYLISAESILLASPDLVIMGGYFNSEDTIENLESMGIPVVILKDDNSLENIYFNIDLIGEVLGKTTEAQTLIDEMQSAIDKIVDWTASLDVDSPSVAVFMYYGSSYGTYACGTEYLLGTPLIELLGGTNAFSSISGMYAVVTTESVATADPDVVIDATPSSVSDLNSIKTNTITEGISAVQNDAIYGTFDSSSTAFTMSTQGIVNAIAMMAMFMYEDQLDFEFDHYMGDDYMTYLDLFWEQINS
jgi:iron complex transport system substrate-binding protein